TKPHARIEWPHRRQTEFLSPFQSPPIGQIPRFVVATKFQNVIVSGDQVRFSASSSACFVFSPLLYSKSNALFISSHRAGANPARRSPLTLSAAILSLPVAIEKGGISFPTPEFPCRSETAPIRVN